ncbi:unnamed protein product, partial [Chrysoparadoxa australica]
STLLHPYYLASILVAAGRKNMAAAKLEKAAEDGLHEALDTVEQFQTYEDYLYSQVTETDTYYLEDEDLARQLVELGYRGSGDTLSREEFEARKKAFRERSNQKSNAVKQLASAGKDFSNSPFLTALANREELVHNGKLTSIIFIRDKTAKGQEVSGYIDFAHRLRTEPFECYYDKRRRLMPKPTDLSYYNWETQTSTSNSTPNFQVIADGEAGLLFKNKRDRKVVNVDPRAKPGDNTTRTEIKTPEYIQVVIYDHMTRRKG